MKHIKVFEEHSFADDKNYETHINTKLVQEIENVLRSLDTYDFDMSKLIDPIKSAIKTAIESNAKYQGFDKELISGIIDARIKDLDNYIK